MKKTQLLQRASAGKLLQESGMIKPWSRHTQSRDVAGCLDRFPHPRVHLPFPASHRYAFQRVVCLHDLATVLLLFSRNIDRPQFEPTRVISSNVSGVVKKLLNDSFNDSSKSLIASSMSCENCLAAMMPSPSTCNIAACQLRRLTSRLLAHRCLHCLGNARLEWEPMRRSPPTRASHSVLSWCGHTKMLVYQDDDSFGTIVLATRTM